MPVDNTERDAEIRKLLAEGRKQREIAELYGLARSRIAQIKGGYKWRKNKLMPAVEKQERVKLFQNLKS